jgi:SNF2 family DNA or RNA helicase
MSPADRIDACAKFNTRNSPVDVLLTSLSIASYGLNLQHDCYKGLLLQYTWNINTILQVFGRIVRVGQQRETS